MSLPERARRTAVADNRGSSLVLALAVIAIIATLVVAGFQMSAAVGESAFRRSKSNELFYLAQAGVEEAMGNVFSASDDWTVVPAVPVPESPLAAGVMEVIATHREKDLVVVLVRGRVGNDSLTVEATLGRSASGGVKVLSWNDPRTWEWPS